MSGVITVIILVISCSLCIDSKLTIQIKCGDKVCKKGEYCSEFEAICEPCSAICDEGSHNYEPTLCEKSCQDYLHDLRYLRKDGSGDASLRSAVQYISRMLTVTLTLVSLMLLILISLFCIQLYRCSGKQTISWDTLRRAFWRKSNNVPKTNARMESSPNKKPTDLKLTIPPTMCSTDLSPVTVTTSISRRPAEDSALDYVYENPAMNHQ